ncbi:MAG: hypothetical protein K2X66_08685, partial [Cyanobacteria bacterium]|nr:hypothetical protein [Cyanobacteriota bacterium]
ILKSKIFPGTVKKLGFGKPSPNVKNPFCSEAVAYAYWKAGIRINPRLGKQEPAAYTPENLFNGLELIYP